MKITLPQPFEAVEKYVAKLEPSVSGQSGHDRLFEAVCKLMKNFNKEEALHGIEVYNNTKCSPAWSKKDILHKIKSASNKVNYTGGDVYTAPAVETKIHKKAIQQFALPTITKHHAEAAIEVLTQAFDPDDIINLGEFKIKSDGKKTVVPQDNYKVADLIETYKANGLDKYEHGVAICINPLNSYSSRRDTDNIKSFRHILVECDRGTIQEQYNLIRSLDLPVSVLVHSAGTGLHAWVRVDAKDREEHTYYASFLKTVFGQYNEVKDLSVMDAPRYSRFAGYTRGDKEQVLYGTNLGAPDFKQWKESYEKENFPYKFKRLDYYRFGNPLEFDKTIELIRHDFITTDSISVWFSFSGIGKSVAMIQTAMSLALGKKVFGFQPTKKIKSVIFQWEDAEKRIQKFVGGVERGLNLDEDQMLEIGNNVTVPDRNDFRKLSMPDFFLMLESYLDKFHPDMVWLNPISAFFQGDLSKSPEVTMFRQKIDMLTDKYNCHIAIVAHVPKLMKFQSGQRQDSLDQYDVFGSSVLSNWARSMVAIQKSTKVDETNPDEQLYAIKVVKGSADLDWRNRAGERTDEFYIGYSQDSSSIHWVEFGYDKITTRRAVKTKEAEANLSTLVNLLTMTVEEIPTKALNKKQITDKLDLHEDTVKKKLKETPGIKSEIRENHTKYYYILKKAEDFNFENT